MIESMAVFESQLGSIKVVSCEDCCRFHRLAYIFCGGIRHFFCVILPRHDSCSSEVEITENRDYWIPEWWGHLCWEYFVHCSDSPQKLEKKCQINWRMDFHPFRMQEEKNSMNMRPSVFLFSVPSPS